MMVPKDSRRQADATAGNSAIALERLPDQLLNIFITVILEDGAKQIERSLTLLLETLSREKRFWRDPSIRQFNKAAREIIEKFTIALTY